MAMNTLVQMKQWRASRWIIGELWETLSPHVPVFHLGKVNTLCDEPHTAMDMKLQLRDTVPHASKSA